jgi:putrescine transport system substrate-binding protein
LERNSFVPAVIFSLFALLTGWCANAQEEKILNVYNWADYIAPNTLADFEAEFGIKVNYDLYDSTEIVDAKLLAGKTGYDVIVHAARYSARLIPIGVYQPLDKSKLPLWENLDPWVLDSLEVYDPGNLYGFPYMWGTTGIAYNIDMVNERMPDAPVDSGDILFRPEIAAKFADCGISMLDEPTTIIPLAMQYLGYDLNSMDPAHINEVENLIKAVRPYIRYFSSSRLISDLPNEELCIAVSWSGDYAQAMQRAIEVGADVKLAYAMPKEGTVVWFDNMFIPSDAPHPDNAHLFINYLLRPNVIAEITDVVRYANGNRASMALMPPEIVDDPAVYPTAEQLEHADPGLIFGPKLERRRTRAWSRIKTGL